MNIAFFVYHPVEPQMYYPLAQKLKRNDTNVIFILFEKECIEEVLLKGMGFKYFKVNKHPRSTFFKILKIFKTIFFVRKLLIQNNIDLIFSATSVYAGIPAFLTKSKRIGFTDTETAWLNNFFAAPFFQSIITPDCFYKRIPSQKHIPIKSYKELAYLHPSRFLPNGNILNELSLKSDEKIVLLRFSALNASHDIGLKSKADQDYEKILYYVKELSKYARVFISCTEKELGPEFIEYKLKIHPSQYIHLLSYCTLYIGEGTTTASEAGVLGVPWINIQEAKRGYLIDQEKNYKLGLRISDLEKAFEIALEWIKSDDIKLIWQEKRQKLLLDKIDFTTFLVWFIENYPDSHSIIKNNPDYQNRFK